MRKLMWSILCGAAIAAATFYHVGAVLATPANSGFKATTIATGTFGDINVFNHQVSPSTGEEDDPKPNIWLSLQQTKGRSDLYVQSNVWQPGASTGWHSHPGHSLIIVTAGTLTDYDGDCKPHVYTFVSGSPPPTFVDPGGGHVHIVRNEGSVAASAIAVQLVPYDPTKTNRRIDAPAPENCSNIQ